MIAAAPVIAGLTLSLAAVAGLALLHRAVAARGALAPLNRRFLFGIRVTLALYLGRALWSLTGAAPFALMVMVAAALIPLAVLLLAEGLLRRHAPPPVKALLLVGTPLMVALALLPAGWVEPVRSSCLLGFQLLVFLAVGWLIAARDRTSLEPAEHVAVVRLALSLVVMVPAAALDFLGEGVGLPVQPSALAVLILCRLGLSLTADTHQRGAVLSLGLMGPGVALLAVVLGVMTGQNGAGMLVIGAVVLAFGLLADIIRAALTDEGPDLMPLLTVPPGDLAGAILRHPLGQGGGQVGPEALADLDLPLLRRTLAAHGVLVRTARPDLPGPEAEQVDHLFAVTGASHLIALSVTAPHLLALRLPSLSAGPGLLAGLQALHRRALEGQAP